jgi:hypothetical protein
LPLVVMVGLLVYVGSKINFPKFVAALSHLNYPAYIAFTIGWTLAVCAGDTIGTVSAYRLTTPSVTYKRFFLFRLASYLPSVANYHLGTAFLTYVMSKFFRVPIRRMTGATLLSYATWMGWLLGCMAIAIPFTKLPKMWTPIILVAGVLYLIVIAIAPRRLAEISFLSPLFEAGLKGHAVALAARFPHFAVLVLGGWASLEFFHIGIPTTTALVYMPILLVAVTLPITPQGAGTREAIAGVFFAAFAPGSNDEERMANVAAATTSWTVSNTILCLVLGIIASRMVSKQLAALPPEAPKQPEPAPT